MTLLARLRDRCLRLLVGPVLRGEVEYRPERLRWLAEHGAVPEGVCRCPGCGVEGPTRTSSPSLFLVRRDTYARCRLCRECNYRVGGYRVSVPSCTRCHTACACCAEEFAAQETV